MIQLCETTDYPDHGFCCCDCGDPMPDVYVTVDVDSVGICLCPPCAFKWNKP